MSHSFCCSCGFETHNMDDAYAHMDAGVPFYPDSGRRCTSWVLRHDECGDDCPMRGGETPNPKGDSVMSKFKPGDRVRSTPDHSMTATVLAAYRDRYWVKYDDDYEPATMYATDIDRCYELVPESFLPDGDRYSVVYANGVVSIAFSSLFNAERVYRDSAGALGIIRIDGTTGALSWVKGGPKEGTS